MNQFNDYTWKWMINDKERRKKLYDILYPYIEGKTILEMNCGFSPLSEYLKKGTIIGFDRYRPAIVFLTNKKQRHHWFSSSSREFCFQLDKGADGISLTWATIIQKLNVFALLGICEGQEKYDESKTPEDIWEVQSANTLIGMYKPGLVILEQADYKNPVNLQRIQKWIDGFYTLLEAKQYSVTDSERIRQRTIWIYRWHG